MIFITQLIYIVKGQAEVFEQFESIAIPIISKYNGKLMLRIRPQPDSIIEANTEIPYEIHLVTFKSENDFENFKHDEQRKQFLHLKEKSIRSAILIQGTQL
jgi:uncharacterized protein (DUF1330 family)